MKNLLDFILCAVGKVLASLNDWVTTLFEVIVKYLL